MKKGGGNQEARIQEARNQGPTNPGPTNPGPTNPEAANPEAANQGSRVGAVEFAALARSLGAAAQRAGLVAPVFRSPPRRAGCLRTIRRQSRVVSVRFRDRLVSDVLADMVEGVLVANDVPDARQEVLRRRLLHEAGAHHIADRRAVA